MYCYYLPLSSSLPFIQMPSPLAQTVCQLMCEMCLSKLSRQELHRDMNSVKSVGWKLLDSSLTQSKISVWSKRSGFWLGCHPSPLLSSSAFPSQSSLSFHFPRFPFLIPSPPPFPLSPQSAIESLFGASLTGVAYSLFAGQPLTILGSTGPVLVFEKILFKFCKWVWARGF